MKTSERPYNDPALREALKQQDPGATSILTENLEQRVMDIIKDTKVVPTEMARLQWLTMTYKVAAIFIGILMLSGIAYAAYRVWGIGNIESTIHRTVETEQLQSTETESNIVRFDNVQLDSVFQVVAQYYNKQIVYRNDSVRYHRMLIEWNQAEPLASFILLINNFDGIYVTEANDSIIVE